MSADGLVARLHAAIDERERVARAATQTQWGVRYFDDDSAMNAVAVTIVDAGEDPEHGETVALTLYQQPRVVDIGDGRWDENAAHIALNDPAAVLRLCQAHRDILDDYAHTRQVSERLIERDCLVGTRVVQQRAVNALERVVRALARGYGVGDGERGE